MKRVINIKAGGKNNHTTLSIKVDMKINQLTKDEANEEVKKWKDRLHNMCNEVFYVDDIKID